MTRDAIDFQDAVEELLGDPEIGKDDGVAILGGVLEAKGGETLEHAAAGFLKPWDLARMPYRIWEYEHRITFTEPEVAEWSLLERGRIFGEAGDLSLRRDGKRFLWHFIGQPQPATPKDAQDFWKHSPECQANPDFKMRRRRKLDVALLWGEYDATRKRWHDDRVAWAKLDYPLDIEQQTENNGTRVKIAYDLFTDRGQIAFVWWKEIKKWQPAKSNA
ncbi:hypothetical protein HUU39_05745 [candidate division KSB1 bacterium]|nr:hypothetical protein [bacterium]NUM64764.1 hypothetical protein [candidate division KSB1 bacterium]